MEPSSLFLLKLFNIHKCVNIFLKTLVVGTFSKYCEIFAIAKCHCQLYDSNSLGPNTSGMEDDHTDQLEPDSAGGELGSGPELDW